MTGKNGDDILKRFKEIAKPIIEKLNEIVETFKNSKTAKVAIITHNNPDPDAMASTLVIKKYLRSKNVQVEILADEEGASRETKVIINKIGIEIRPPEELNKNIYKAIILVDVASINQSNISIKGVEPDLIIDHHRDEDPYESTATIITLLMSVLGFELEKDLATALYTGLELDTIGLTSGKFTDFDELAYKILSDLLDFRLRVEIIQAGYSLSYLEMLDNAIKYLDQKGNTIISSVGYISDRQKTDLSKIANFFLLMDGVEKVIVLAIVTKEKRDSEGNIVAYEKFMVPAVRSSSPVENAGDLCKRVFGEKVSGGDPVKASGQVKLDPKLVKLIDQAKKDDNEKALEGYIVHILNRCKEKILEEETK